MPVCEKGEVGRAILHCLHIVGRRSNSVKGIKWSDQIIFFQQKLNPPWNKVFPWASAAVQLNIKDAIEAIFGMEEIKYREVRTKSL